MYMYTCIYICFLNQHTYFADIQMCNSISMYLGLLVHICTWCNPLGPTHLSLFCSERFKVMGP